MSALARQRATELERGQYAQRIGGRVVALGDGTAEVDAPYRDIHANTYGLVHGGIAASLACWAGALAAWTSQRVQQETDLLRGRMLSLHVNYLAVAREEALRAVAVVSQRGREAVHLRADVLAGARLVAQAAMVYRIALPVLASAQPISTYLGRRRAWSGGALAGQAPLPLVSPFIRSAGIVLRRSDRELAAMTMPLAGNADAGGMLDEGALVGCIDTCAALACKPFHEVIPSKSTTVSLSVAFGEPVADDVGMVGCLEARDGEIFTTTVEASAGDHSRCAASAVVVYRFA
ncbi:MAG TPA: PaaI family thioesterase [Candidatus Limnocylindrales bacterium]|nr:PaaI family thioesterase [Candidatus Limnocylindrales bacterium]